MFNRFKGISLYTERIDEDFRVRNRTVLKYSPLHNVLYRAVKNCQKTLPCKRYNHGRLTVYT